MFCKTNGMRNLIVCLIGWMVAASACGQKNYDDAEVEAFAAIVAQHDVVVVDVRTPAEFAEGHILNAVNIDVRQDGFMEKARVLLPRELRLAIYCRSGRRSAEAAAMLADAGYRVVNLSGGITAWTDAGNAVSLDNHEIDVFVTKGGRMVRMHTLMHASIHMEYDGREIAVDPVRKLGDRTVDYSALPKADYIFVTHEHFDHFDKGAISLLTDDHTRLITNSRCAGMLELPDGQCRRHREQLASGRATARAGKKELRERSGKCEVTVMANGDTVRLADDISVEAVAAYNITDGHQQFHPKGRDNGYILTLDGLRIYIAGDTEDIPEMEDLGQIDIAFLPCNQPYTMTPAQMVKAAKTVKPRVLFPYHFGQTDMGNIPTELKDHGIEVRIRHYE